jgi:hypothetical protein
VRACVCLLRAHLGSEGHAGRGGNSAVKIGPPIFDLLDQIVCSDFSCACLFGSISSLASGKDSNAHFLAGAMRKHDEPAQRLVRLSRVDVESDCHVDALDKFPARSLLHRVY